MPINDTLKKAYGLFFEAEESDSPTETPATIPAPSATMPAAVEAPLPRATKTVEQIAREQPGPSLEEIKVPATPTQPIEREDGSVDYGAIYAMAGVSHAPFTAEQVLEILASLPADLPLESRRATMKVTLNAMGATLGVTPETVVADASRKLTALDAYAQSFTDQAKTYVEKAEADILRMEQEIARRKENIEAAKARQSRMVAACVKESERLDDVLEFFSLDAGTSKLAPESST